MSKLNGLNSLKARYGLDKNSHWGIVDKEFDSTMGDKVNVRGKESHVYANPLLRLREDKLRSLKRAIYDSYQSAVIVFDKDDRQYHFRCLINHDKLKVDYEDKILSIPFRQIPVEYENDKSLSMADKIVDTGTPGQFLDEAGLPVINDEDGTTTFYRVKAGDTFKWISGNEGYMPDSYWIIFLQYSEETAYFRGQIRKADDLIQIIPIEEDGSEGDPLIYHGWTTGPNETQAIWNVKKGVVWNDLYYHKILYITKDENTQAYFRRFDRVIINGQTWQVQGYNDNYGTTSKNYTGGMIRVALKETYTSTNEILKKIEEQDEEYDRQIIGPITIQSYDVVTYYVPNGTGLWDVPAASPLKVLLNENGKLKVEVQEVSQPIVVTLSYGRQTIDVTIQPFK